MWAVHWRFPSAKEFPATELNVTASGTVAERMSLRPTDRRGGSMVLRFDVDDHEVVRRVSDNFAGAATVGDLRRKR